jgi:hypothetical protein
MTPENPDKIPPRRAESRSKRIADKEFGLHEMREISFEVPLSELRRIVAFLVDCADRAEASEWRSNHRHIEEFASTWPDCDVIVIHPSPDPPSFVDS